MRPRRALAHALRCLTTLGAALGLSVGIAGCGGGGGGGGAGGSPHTTRTAGENGTRTVQAQQRPPRRPVLDVYSSLPLVGPAAADGRSVMDGIRLALVESRYRAGSFVIRYRSLDDARRGHGAWDARVTAANARRAATDPNAVAYVGEFDSAATEISLPILNVAGIPQLNATSTYVGLTERVDGVSGVDEPLRFYPSGYRTFLRVIPNDAVQAAAGLLALHQIGCTRLAVAWTGPLGGYGAGLAQLIALERSYYGVALVADSRVSDTAAALRLYAAGARARGAGCVAVVGASTATAAALADAVHLVDSDIRILGSDRLCDRAWTDFRLGGVLPVVDPALLCTAPVAPMSVYPGGSTFLSGWQSLFGRKARPGRYAIYGYVAMEAVLDAITDTAQAGDRASVLRTLFSARNSDSVVGPFAFDREGDTSLRSYGLYRVGLDGGLQFDRLLVPARVYVGGAR